MAVRNGMRQRKLPLDTGTEPTVGQGTRRGGSFFLLFFACASMFVLGVLVGRGTAPVRFDMERLQAELSALRGMLDQRKAKPPELEKPAKTRKEKALEHTDLDFYEALKDSKDAARLNRDVARVADLPALPQAPADEAAAALATTAPAPPAAKPATATEPFRPAPAEATAGGGYQLQVASLASAADADALVKRLQERGLAAFRQQVAIPEKGVRYRVRIGGFRSRMEAETELNRLKGEKINGMLLTGGG